MNSNQITWAAVHRSKPFSLSKNFMVIPNVSYGGFSWGEADIVAVNKSNYLYEGEVKISISDLKADFKKKKFTNEKKHSQWLKDIRRHYYIIPKDILEEAKPIVEQTDSGLLYVSETRTGSLSIFTAIEAKTNKLAQKQTDDRILKISRLIAFRYWNQYSI